MHTVDSQYHYKEEFYDDTVFQKKIGEEHFRLTNDIIYSVNKQ